MQLLLCFLWRFRHQLCRSFQPQGQQRQSLAEIIVQLGGQASPLVFLGFDQYPTEPNLLPPRLDQLLSFIKEIDR